jgi:hypothetical protein
MQDTQQSQGHVFLEVFPQKEMCCPWGNPHTKDNLGDGRRSNLIATLFGTWCYPIWDTSKSSIAFKSQE